jgi:parallel beta-helix repeat protein
MNPKITELPEVSQLTSDDILPLVNSPGASPATSKITVTNIDKRYPTVTVGAGAQYETINAAVAALGAAGGKIILKPGAYAPCTLASNIWLIADSHKAIITIPNASQANGILIPTGSTNVRVTGVRVQGNKTNTDNGGTLYETVNCIRAYNSTDIIIEDCYVTDAYFGGVTLDTCTNAIVRGNRSIANRDNGIFVRPNNTRVLIEGNIVSGQLFSGIQALHSDYVNIVNNISYSNGPTSAEGDGIGFEGCRYSSIANNVIVGNGIQGIKVDYTVEGGTQRSLDCVVSDNIIYNHTDSGNGCGIEVLRSDNITIQNNRIKTAKYGINVGEIVGITIKGNIVTNTTDQGIRCHDTSSTGKIVIDGNTVTTTGSHGIETFQNRINITNNIVSASSDQGIRISDGDNAWIEGNTIFDNANNGILISSSAGAVDVRNNNFYNTAAAQDRGLYEEGGGGPTRLVGNRYSGMATADYELNTAGSYNEYGVYTPTLTGVTNVAASTAYECQYAVVGKTVTVTGKVDVDPTSTGSTKLGISLPVASNLANAEDLAGVAFSPAVAGQGAAVLGDTTNDRAQMEWIAVDTSNRTMAFSFSYQIL